MVNPLLSIAFDAILIGSALAVIALLIAEQLRTRHGVGRPASAPAAARGRAMRLAVGAPHRLHHGPAHARTTRGRRPHRVHLVRYGS
jgi:hypothetical protein